MWHELARHTASCVATVISSHVDRAIDERALLRARLCASRRGNSLLDARYALRARPWGWRGTAAQTQGRGGGGGEGRDTLAPSSPEKPGTRQRAFVPNMRRRETICRK